jgi:flagellar protein FlgJ
MAEKHDTFVETYYPLAVQAGARFGMNPMIILAQAAVESGWGTSFGITAAGSPNEFWDGSFSVGQNQYALKFRNYRTAQDSFMDFARLISSKYGDAHRQSYAPAAYAQAIAYSPYIAEQNGDNREGYRTAVLSSWNRIVDIAKKKDLPPPQALPPAGSSPSA